MVCRQSKRLTHMTYDTLIEKLKDTETFLENFLDNKIQNNNGFPARTFYGEAYFGLFKSGKTTVDGDYVTNLLDYSLTNNRKDPDFHWEFINLAVLKVSKKIGLPSSTVDGILTEKKELRFKNTDALNWKLMRVLARLLYHGHECHPKVTQELDILVSKVSIFRLKSKLIEDQPNDYSHQYHAYILALLVEINRILKIENIDLIINSGLEYLLKSQLSNGCAMFLGRGQEQIFGYACYLYVLSEFYKKSGDIKYLNAYVTTHRYVVSFKNSELGLPLTLNSLQREIPDIVDLKDKQYSGWYTYNNHFDYLAFFLYYFSQSVQNIRLSQSSNYQVDRSCGKSISYRYRFGTKLWSNDLSFPLVFDNDNQIFITSCFGGEQYSPSVMSSKDLPFPFIRRFEGSLWKNSILIYKSKNSAVYVTLVGIILRRIFANYNEVSVETVVWGPFKINVPILINEEYQHLAQRSDYKFDGFTYTPLGKFMRFYTKTRKTKFIIKMI